MASDKKNKIVVTMRSRNSSGDSTTSSMKSQRVARFAEATTVDSPIGLSYAYQLPSLPLSDRTNHYQPQAQPADVGFGYLEDPNNTYLGVEMPATPGSPLKSALKTPNTLSRYNLNPLSPTFREEVFLGKREDSTEKEQAKDIKVKIRVRIAKVFLRCTNFSCSLIVFSMLTSTFTIFNATRTIPPRNDLPPWAIGTNPWPQITLLVIACVSLVMCMMIFWAYSKGGHERAERASVYYTAFSMGFYTFSIIMWGIGAGILHSSKQHGKEQDIWGWSCNDNTRKQLFQADVSYSLVCRLQNWSLVCALIEVVVETITIFIYGIVFYRFWSKRKLRISMAQRDDARSELYLAQSRIQSTVNTPAFAPNSAYPLLTPAAPSNDKKNDTSVNVYSEADEGNSDTVRYISAEPSRFTKPFTLQAPPVRGTPKVQQSHTFVEVQTQSQGILIVRTPPSTGQTSPRPLMSPGPREPVFQSTVVHTPAAPGEVRYGEVPIPAAYTSTVRDP